MPSLARMSPTSRTALALVVGLSGIGLAGTARAAACDAPATHQIAQVQGAGTVTPLSGQTVRVEGIVTGDFQRGDQFRGFFLQDPTPDDDPATSDGLFAYAGTGLQPTRPVTFKRANPRPGSPGPVGSANVRVASFDTLNWFTTLDRRGADTAAEQERQITKLVAALKGLNADRRPSTSPTPTAPPTTTPS